MDKTLIKGLKVLEWVANADRRVRTAQVATEFDLTMSNAHRVLKTLELSGYIVQDQRTKEYSCRLKLWELGSRIVERLDLRNCAAADLHALAQKTGEAVHLSVLDGAEVIYLDKIDSPQPIGAYTRVAGRAPAYCVATGKALLAEIPEEELTQILGELPSYSRQTITDREVLIEHLRATRTRGFSVNSGEWREGVWGIAAVVRDSRKKAIAAIGVSGPDFRFSDSTRTTEVGEIVRFHAANISRELGFIS